MLKIIMKSLKIVITSIFLLTNNACADQSHRPQNDKPLKELQSILPKSTDIKIQFASFMTDNPEGTPVEYAEDNPYIFLRYKCHINCGRNATHALQEMLATAQWISKEGCKGAFFLGRVSLHSDDQEMWLVYTDSSGDFISYKNECYYLKTRLDPVMSSGGILLWNRELR